MKPKIRARPVVRANFSTSLAGSLSFLSSLITASILSFFVDALRRAYMSIPWPIILVMSASCLNISVLFITSLLRCIFPLSTIFQLLLHLPIAILWVVTVSLLGHELGVNLVRACPAADTFGNDMALACQLFKTLFSFAVLSTACSLLLVVLDTLSIIRLKKATAYTAMTKNTGIVDAQNFGYTRSKGKKSGMLTEMLRRRDRNIEEDEKSTMMKDINLEGKRNNMLELGPSNASSYPHQLSVPSPERDQGIGSNTGNYPNKFANQNTQYDAGNNMI